MSDRSRYTASEHRCGTGSLLPSNGGIRRVHRKPPLGTSAAQVARWSDLERPRYPSRGIFPGEPSVRSAVISITAAPVPRRAGGRHDMRHEDVGRRGTAGTCGQVRGNALWGDGKRTLAVTLAALLISAVALVAGRIQAAEASDDPDAYMSPGLLAEATASPDGLFDVIVQARKGKKTEDVAEEVAKVQKDQPGKGSKLKRKFISIAGTSATL